MLEAAAINPHDGDAQYQLGLIYQQRRRYSDAIERFQKTVAIDPTETDAHFQLGRIAMEQGRVADAIARFETVLRQDEKHSSSEVHRDLGSAYLAAGRIDDARRELETYTDRRELFQVKLDDQVLASHAYDAAGRRTGRTYANGRTTQWGYDADDRNTRLDHVNVQAWKVTGWRSWRMYPSR